VGSVDELYGVPREEFVAARTGLARKLAAEGDKEGAAEVKRLKKPSVAAAAVNLAARRHPEAVVRLLDAGTELRHAQEEALGGGSAEGLREATRNLASVVDEVAKLAAKEGGVSAAQRDRIVTTLRAAATDDDAADLLRRGVLVEDLEVAGFGMGDAPLPPRPKAAKPKAEDKAAAQALAGAKRALRVAEDEADTAARRSTRQAERAEEAERRAEEAAAAAKEAKADAKRMAAEAKEARQRADEAAAQLEKLQADR
jgi:hypothetical protein